MVHGLTQTRVLASLTDLSGVPGVTKQKLNVFLCRRHRVKTKRQCVVVQEPISRATILCFFMILLETEFLNQVLIWNRFSMPNLADNGTGSRAW